MDDGHGDDADYGEMEVNNCKTWDTGAWWADALESSCKKQYCVTPPECKYWKGNTVFKYCFLSLIKYWNGTIVFKYWFLSLIEYWNTEKEIYYWGRTVLFWPLPTWGLGRGLICILFGNFHHNMSPPGLEFTNFPLHIKTQPSMEKICANQPKPSFTVCLLIDGHCVWKIVQRVAIANLPQNRISATHWESISLGVCGNNCFCGNDCLAGATFTPSNRKITNNLLAGASQIIKYNLHGQDYESTVDISIYNVYLIYNIHICF